MEGLSSALGSLATEDPGILDDLVERLPANPPRIIDSLKLGAWATNPERYADHILRLLIDREDLGGASEFARAVSEGTRLGSRDLCAQLEQLVLKFAPKQEQGERSGSSQFQLLSHFAAEALSSYGKQRLNELRRKFGEETSPKRPLAHQVTASMVPPRIPDNATARMSDENWLRAMRTMQSRRTPGPRYPDWDEVTLSRQLEARTKIEPERFTRLAMDQMSDDLPPRYFSAILDGLASTEHEKLPLKEVLQVIRRLHELPGRPCGLAVGRAVRAIAGEQVPVDVLEAIEFYATKDPDPSGDEWLMDPPREPDPVTAAINSVRGVAAEAIRGLIVRERRPDRAATRCSGRPSAGSDTHCALTRCAPSPRHPPP